LTFAGQEPIESRLSRIRMRALADESRVAVGGA
jgi:hypothetical protein